MSKESFKDFARLHPIKYHGKNYMNYMIFMVPIVVCGIPIYKAHLKK